MKILLAILLLLPVIAQADVTTGLVGWWTLDEVSGSLVDTSASGLNGSATGTTVVSGKISNSRSFNGSSDFISVTDSGSIFALANTTFTVSVWFKNGNNGAIIAKSGGTSGWNIGAGTTFSSNTKNTSGSCILRSSSSSSLNDGKWHLGVAIITTDTVTAGNNHITLYVDSVLDQGAESGTLVYTSPTTALLTFGKRTTLTSAFYSGGCDNIRIYNRALTAADVLQLYNQGIYGNIIN